MTENEIGSILIRSAIQIHRKIGPGLFESVYESVLENQLQKEGLTTERQVGIPIEFEGIQFDEGFRADLVIENKVIVELKCVEKIGKIHQKQLLTYLKLSGKHLGFLLNFNEILLKNGVYRIVNQLED